MKTPKCSDCVEKIRRGFFWETDLELRICHYVSADVGALLGYPADQWYENPGFWEKHLHEDDQRPSKIYFDSVLLGTGNDSSIEHRIKKSDGESIWLQTTAWLEKNSHGINVIRGQSFDISNLMERLDFSTALNRSLGEGVCALDKKGIVTYLNATGVWLLGWTHGELIGRHVHCVAPIPEEVLKGKSVSSVPLTFAKKSGLQFPSLYSASPIRKAGGKIVGTVIVFQDITEIRETENRLTQTKENLERVILERTKDIEELKTERKLRELFIATLSHDLRNPLTSALLCVSLLQRGQQPPEKLASLVSRMERCLNRADRMIQNLLDVHLIEAGLMLPLHIENFDLIELAQSLLDDLEFVYRKRDEFTFDPPQISVQWCKSSIWRMMENLLNNAHKYGEREKPICLSIKKIAESDRVSISIKNQGPPIKDLSSVFEPFFRSESARKGKEKGWGLGLTVVQGIVESHHGTINVESTLEQGTIFVVEIPSYFE